MAGIYVINVGDKSDFLCKEAFIINREIFNNLSKENQDVYLEEWFKFETIIENNAISVDEAIKVFNTICIFITKTGFDSQKINNFIIGMYPYDELNNLDSKEKAEYILGLSNEIKCFIDYWNIICKKEARRLNRQ